MLTPAFRCRLGLCPTLTRHASLRVLVHEVPNIRARPVQCDTHIQLLTIHSATHPPHVPCLPPSFQLFTLPSTREHVFPELHPGLAEEVLRSYESSSGFDTIERFLRLFHLGWVLDDEYCILDDAPTEECQDWWEEDLRGLTLRTLCIIYFWVSILALCAPHSYSILKFSFAGFFIDYR